MPRVLLLARHFPPIGGAGVHRTLGSVRHLPEHGYELVVVTGPASHRDRWSPHDAELLNRVPEGTEVHRVEGPEPTPRTGLAARLEGLSRLPAPWIRWWIEQSVRLGREVGAGADLVLASCLPYETALAGARLAAELGTPWVADLEDPWALDEMWAFPDRRAPRVSSSAGCARALSSASAVVMAAPEAAVRLRRAMPELARRPPQGSRSASSAPTSRSRRPRQGTRCSGSCTRARCTPTSAGACEGRARAGDCWAGRSRGWTR